MPPKKKAIKTNGYVEVPSENGTESVSDIVKPAKNAKKAAAKTKEPAEASNGHLSEEESSLEDVNESASPPAKKSKKIVAGKASAKDPKPKDNNEKEPKRKRGAKATAEPAEDSIPEDEKLSIG